MSSEFDLRQSYRRLVDRWTWVVAAGLAAGLLGLLASSFRPPLYEASATLGIGIDRNRADVPDDITVRQAYDRVRGLLLADDTLERAILLGTQGDSAGGPPETSVALHGRIRLVEEPEGWELFVVSPNGVEAERMAQAWAEAGLEGLESASLHAIRAGEWQGVLYEASCSLAPSPLASGSARWQCKFAPLEGSADELPASILAEVEASRGVLPALTYSLLRGSNGTAHPVVWGRGTLVLGAAVVGLVIGVVIASRKR
jgi:hypothetical protein